MVVILLCLPVSTNKNDSSLLMQLLCIFK